MKLVNWNVQWATPRSRRRTEILRRIYEHNPEVICLTETHNELLDRDGYTISSQPDYGYAIKPHRRKVMLWSREPWEQVDDVGDRIDAARTVRVRRHADVAGRGHRRRNLHPLVCLTERKKDATRSAKEALGRP